MKKIIFSLLLFFPEIILSQNATEKVIKEQMQTWISLNTNTKVKGNWGVLGDIHARWNDFFKSDNFYLIRGGVNYTLNSQTAIAGGYAHVWYAPSQPEWHTYSNENRLFEQVQWSGLVGKIGFVHRIRNEQRWQEKIVEDIVQKDLKFTNRIRYLISMNIPIFKNKKLPVLVLSDELMLQFGKEVVYNTFDQNRFFIGMKKSITSTLSFDLGYMNVYQQKNSGYQYDMNHTLRLFFYLNSQGKK